MLKENLKTLREQKGMSQEICAQKLGVVRQTISKWEKGLSVPDADMLIRIADLFDTSVSELLGSKIEQEENVNEIAVQLALLNEHLAENARMRREAIAFIKKAAKIAVEIIIIYILICFVGAILPSWGDTWYEFGQNLYHQLHP